MSKVINGQSGDADQKKGRQKILYYYFKIIIPPCLSSTLPNNLEREELVFSSVLYSWGKRLSEVKGFDQDAIGEPWGGKSVLRAKFWVKTS